MNTTLSRQGTPEAMQANPRTTEEGRIRPFLKTQKVSAMSDTAEAHMTSLWAVGAYWLITG